MMPQDYAMLTLGQLLPRPAPCQHAGPLDPVLRATVTRLVGELDAIGLRRPGR